MIREKVGGTRPKIAVSSISRVVRRVAEDKCWNAPLVSGSSKKFIPQDEVIGSKNSCHNRKYLITASLSRGL